MSAQSLEGGASGARCSMRSSQHSEGAGLWTLQAGIFPENAASVRLHEACGFRTVGRRERIAQMQGVWRDTLLLERHSRVVGVD